MASPNVWKSSAAAKQIEENWSRREFATGARDAGSPSLLKTVLLARVVESGVSAVRRRR